LNVRANPLNRLKLPLQLSKIPSDGPTFEPDTFIGNPRRCVSRIVAGFDHHNLHARPAQFGESCFQQHPCNALTLSVRIDGEYVDFAHAILSMQTDANPPRKAFIIFGYESVLRLIVKKSSNVIALPYRPAFRIEGTKDVRCDGGLEFAKDRCPRPQRQPHHRSTMSVFVGMNMNFHHVACGYRLACSA
jgi:hypothetical protein